MLAPAKVNLVLRVGPRRPDGYHDLCSLLVALDVGDELELEPARATLVEAPGLEGGDTLVTRALALLADAAGHGGGWRVRIAKRIPAGAGLGGGSSDAGTALRAANAMLPNPLAPAALLEVAARVGSDVPFFAAGHRAALLRGRGEQLDRLDVDSSLSFVLAWPGRTLSTAAVYAAPGPRCSATELDAAAVAIRELAGAPPATLAAAVANDLAAPAERLCPPTARLRHLLAAGEPLAADVCGSGSAVFGLFADRAAAERAAQGLQAAAWKAVAAPGVVR